MLMAEIPIFKSISDDAKEQNLSLCHRISKKNPHKPELQAALAFGIPATVYFLLTLQRENHVFSSKRRWSKVQVKGTSIP